jgi:hypothetical protein
MILDMHLPSEVPEFGDRRCGAVKDNVTSRPDKEHRGAYQSLLIYKNANV